MESKLDCNIGPFGIHFKGPASVIHQIRPILNGWIMNSNIDYSLVVNIQFALADKLPERPDQRPDAVDVIENRTSRRTVVAVYRQGKKIVIDFGGIAISNIRLESKPQQNTHNIEIWIEERFLSTGLLEDLLFTSIAPIFRRQEFYFIHAFAVTYGNNALVLVGPSGAGKTTCGLALVVNGWGYLSNDVTMIHSTDEVLIADPTPGGIGITSSTFDYLPSLRQIWPEYSGQNRADRSYIPAGQIVSKWSSPTPITTLCFPEITSRQRTKLEPLNKATALAKLMENSVDRWDKDCLSTHLAILEKLCQQSTAYALKLGNDFDYIARFISVT